MIESSICPYLFLETILEGRSAAVRRGSRLFERDGLFLTSDREGCNFLWRAYFRQERGTLREKYSPCPLQVVIFNRACSLHFVHRQFGRFLWNFMGNPPILEVLLGACCRKAMTQKSYGLYIFSPNSEII